MEVEQQDQLAECLINSLKRKEVKKATKALENGADPNYIGPEGFAAIHLAAGLDGYAGHQLLNQMLRYGGNPNLKSSDNETALHVAVMWNRESAAKLLLAHGADPTIRNSDGLTAFDLAENTSDHELRCLDLLRNSCLDNSSESDLSSSERPILNVPRLSRKQKSPTSFHQSFLSERRTPNEDAVDGMLMDSGFQSKNPSDSPRSLFNNKPTETYPQFPYNPTWIHPSGIDSFRAPYQPQQMSNGLYAPPQRSPSFEPTVQQGQKDSFFDISIHPSRTTDPRGSEVFTNMDSYNSDTQDSIDTAFTFDSDIDSSTSYFSLPKHSLKGLINELKDGEERIVRHKGVNGEASVIIGSDFESRISLGEIPLSIIKNTNDSIITDQLKKNLGKKSAEKLFLRRAKLYENSKRTGRGHSNLRSSPEAQVTSPFNVKRERPNFFRAPFPLITLPSPSMNHREHINQRHDDEVDLNGTTDKHTGQTKVDKTTQKYLDSSEAEEKMPTSSSHSETGMETELTASVSHSKASVAKRQGLSKQAQVVPSVLQPASSVSINGSADINTRTPTTDETLSQPGNEETENEFSLINGIASPRALYTNMFDTPNVTPKSKTLFDQNFLRPCTQSGKTSDGDIFNFGGDVTTSYGRSQNNSNKVKNFSKIQRRIDVLNQSECDVFPTETESGAGESDSNSSGGYSGDMSQGSSPDDVTSVHSMQKFDIRNSPSVTVRNKRRKGMVDESNSKKFEKQSSTESSDITMAEKADEKKAALPISPRKRLNGVTSSSEERDLPDATLPKASNIKKPTSAPHRNVPQSPGHKIRQRVDHTFEESQTVKSPLVPEDLRVYHKAQLERPMNGRRQWERQHKYDCTCELCMTKKGQTPMVASLPHCEHDQCHESNQSCFDDVTVEFDWKDVSLIDSTNTDHSVIVPDELKALDTEELKQRLVKAGEKPGPITENTKNIYIKHLARIEAGVTNKGQDSSSSFMEYVPEMRKELKGVSSEDYNSLEVEMLKDFEHPQKHKWREGTQKTSFNYLLLDPRVISSLRETSHSLSDAEKFSCFVRAIFYVGKGKESRPYEHMQDAIKMKKATDQTAKASDKLKMIWNIWQSGYGVVSLHVFHSIIPVEAYTREACMIEALGLTRLTNLKKGDYYGQAASWKVKKKRQLGIHLLKKALQIFLVEGEKQIKEADI